jgi:hypothetical protein
MTEEDAFRAIDFVKKNASSYGQAKANVSYIEKFLTSLKSELMSDETGTLGAKEAYAYSHPRYKDQLQALKIAIEQESTLKYQMEAAKMSIEVFKTLEFSKRVEARAFQ